MNENINDNQLQPTALADTSLKRPICKLSILAGVFLLSPFLLIIIGFILAGIKVEIPNKAGEMIAIIMVCLAGCAPFIAALSKIRIAMSDGRLGGDRLANQTLIASCVMLFFAASFAISFPKALRQRIQCSDNIRKLAAGLRLYAQTHNGLIPADNWCDALITEADVSPALFVCPASSAVKGECSYALNRQAAGKVLSELPADMVLLFETNYGMQCERDGFYADRQFVKTTRWRISNRKVHKQQWNQTGSVENVGTHHTNGGVFGFIDGDASFESKLIYPDKTIGSGFEELQWDEKGTRYKAADYIGLADIAEPEVLAFPWSVVLVAAAAIVAAVVIIILTRAWMHLVFCLLMSIGAGGVGALLGHWAEVLYQPEYFAGTGAIAGGAAGILAALCYVGILMKLRQRLTLNKSRRQLAVALGIAAGILCATVLHVVLTLVHRPPFGCTFMLAGLPFGITAGAILGMFGGWAVAKSSKTETPIERDLNAVS